MANMTGYRKLTDREIDILIVNQCTAEDWWKIKVREEFDPMLIKKSNFGGKVFLGRNVNIYYIREEIRNYIIEDNVTIRFSESLVTEGESTFGNGTVVNVLNETGGRAVAIYDRMTTQTAYIDAMCRYNPGIAEGMGRLADNYTKKIRSTLGRIGEGSVISNCGMIRNVNTGPCARLEGVDELSNGTVNSTREAPSFVGRGVIARNFIMAHSAELSDKAIVENCFIGQGCRIGKGFSAEHSLFFANCEMLNGEACSVFAGPYSVSHHKSTLLIGGMFSFYNAGSNSNQSNHMYRSGPVHQGVLERGSKTTSGSYILFPARIGPYIVVKGSHDTHPDLRDFPFSYLLEQNGRSVLIPAAYLRKSGLARDVFKWRTRDRRKGVPSDIIRTEMFNPLTIGRIWNAIGLLRTLPVEKDGTIRTGNVTIPAGRAEKAVASYRQAIERYLGEKIAEKLRNAAYDGPESIEQIFSSEMDFQPDYWTDMAGMIAPVKGLEGMREKLTRGEWTDESELHQALEELEKDYPRFEWEFVNGLAAEYYGKPVFRMTAGEIAGHLTSYIENLRFWEEDIRKDFMKDFSEEMRVSYALDKVNEIERKLDFDAVRGIPEEDPFLKHVHDHTSGLIGRASVAIGKLKD